MKRNKMHKNQKGSNKSGYICRWPDCSQSNPQEPTKQLLELTGEFGKVTGSIYKTQCGFIC